MAQSVNPSLLTDHLTFVGDARVPSISGPGTRLFNSANVDSAAVKLLIHGNEGSGQSFTDSSLSNHTITVNGNTTHSTTQSQFSGGSIYFDGSGDYLQLADSADWSNGANDFTWDCWIHPTTSMNLHAGIIHQGETAASQECNTLNTYNDGTGNIRWLIRNASGTLLDIKTASSSVKTNEWYHVAAVRNGSYFTIYINGIAGVTSSAITTAIDDLSWPMFIGKRDQNSGGTSYWYEGYMDEVRITKGAALWRGNFTPPKRRDTLSTSDGVMYNGSCVDFDGTDAYVTYGDVEWLDGLTTVSVCCWLYQDGAPPNSGGVFLSKDNAIECWTKQSTTNQFVLSINNNHIILTGGGVPPIGEWFHVVMTWNSVGDERRLYLNGVLVDENDGGTQSGNSINNTSDGLAIGARANGNYEIDGKIADTKIFSKELSAANVKQLYDDSKIVIPTKQDASGAFLSQGDLLLWAPLMETSGSVAYDGSGYGRIGTYTGTSFLTGQTGCPQLVTGYNKPMLFDGTNDYVSAGNPAALQFTWADNFSLSAWIWRSSAAAGFDHIIGKTFGNYRLALNGQQLSFRLNSNGLIAASGASDIPNDTWTHVTATWATNSSDGGTAKIYINGSLNNTQTGTANWTSGSADFQIGNSSGESYYFNGFINECIAYDKVLSASEIKALASRVTLGKSLNSSVLVTNSSYPMTWVSGASTSGIAGESDGTGLDAFNTTDSLEFVKGQRYRLSYNADIISGGGLECAIVDQIAWTVTKTGFGSIMTTDGANIKEWVCTESGTFVAVWYCNSASCKFVVSDFSIVPIGDPLPPDAMTMGNDVAEQINAKSTNADESTYSYGGTTYKTWTYRTSGTFVVPRQIEVDVVVVGGGGGGGWNVGGGGGAGGLVSQTLTTEQVADGETSYAVVVGAGGVGRYSGMSPIECTSGGDSSISIDGATTAVGGGRAGGYITSWSDGPESGGSGGGGRHSQGGASGTAGQGNAGGTGGSGSPGPGPYAGGGGGGAGIVGGNSQGTGTTIDAGVGGDGKNDFINSSSAETAALLAAALPTVGGGYLAGGGGGSQQGTGNVGIGGKGGGGKGANYSSHDGEAGQVNTGGGGGGEMDGGSGVVIIRYAMPTPKGYWRNDGTSTWTDLSNNGNNGTVNGSPDAILLKQGSTGSRDNQGFDLKQKDVGAVGYANFLANTTAAEYITGDTIVPSGGINAGSDGSFSLMAWVNVEALGATGVSRWAVNKRTQNGNWPCFDMNVGPDGQLVCAYSTTTYGQCLETYTTANGLITENKWYHLAFVKPAGVASTNYLDVKLYINGIETSWTNSLYGNHLYSNQVATSTQPMYIGRFLDGASTGGTWARPWVGQIASVQLYQVGLTTAQVKQNFEAQAQRFKVNRGIIDNGLVLHLDAETSYPGSGTVWKNLAPNGIPTYTLSGWTQNVKDGVVALTHSESVTTDSAYIRSTVVNDYADKTGVQWYMANGPVTLCFWTNQTAWASDGSQTCGSAFSTASDGSSGGTQMQINHGYNYPTNNGYSFRLADASTVLGNPEPLNVWMNHVVTIAGNSGGENAYYYRNGSLYDQDMSISAWTKATTDAYHYLMRDLDDVNNFAGHVAQVLVYKKVLEPGEVKHNFDVLRDRFGV